MAQAEARVTHEEAVVAHNYAQAWKLPGLTIWVHSRPPYDNGAGLLVTPYLPLCRILEVINRAVAF